MTLEEYIRSKLTKSSDGEFMFDAWVEGSSLRILFIHYDEDEDSHGFIVVGNTVVPMRGDEDGTNVRN